MSEYDTQLASRVYKKDSDLLIWLDTVSKGLHDLSCGDFSLLIDNNELAEPLKKAFNCKEFSDLAFKIDDITKQLIAYLCDDEHRYMEKFIEVVKEDQHNEP